jgi:integrase
MRGCITKKGNTYSIIVDLGRDEKGKRKQKWFNGFKTKKQAQSELIKILNQLENNTFVNPEKITLAEYMNQWFEDYVKLKLAPKTVQGYKYIIEKHINPSLGHILIQKLLPIHIQQCYSQKLESGRIDNKGGLSTKSVIHIHRVLRKALYNAEKMQLIQRNVADFVELPKLKKFKSGVYDENQVKALLKVAKENDMYLPILLAVSIGLRLGEVFGLQWKDIDFRDNTIVIQRSLSLINRKLVFHEPKTEKSNRVIVVSDTIINELECQQEKQKESKSIMGQAYNDYDLVNCYDDGLPINPSNYTHRFAKLLKRNGLPHIRFHDLRHTNATLMLKQNIPAKVASERLGHSTVSITLDLYSHVLREMQEEAAKKIDNVIFGG